MQRTQFAVVGAIWLLAAAVVSGQPPKEFKNLQVLPKDIPTRELMGVMRGFSRGLGVRCQYCHVGDESQQTLWDFDFVSDEKASKKTARVMLQMMQEINRSHLPKIGKEAASLLEVSCITCHHGQARPVSLEQVLAEAVQAEGLEAGLEKYGELRSEYYGSHTYDFSERALRDTAGRLLADGKPEAAIAFLQLNLEHFPDAAMSHVFLGDLRARAGDKAAARQSYEKALESMPGNTHIKQKLDELNGAGAE